MGAEAARNRRESTARPTDKDRTVTKHTWGAFTNTDVDEYLRAQGVTQVVVAGVSTSIGVESTARQAHERERRHLDAAHYARLADTDRRARVASRLALSLCSV
jgi:nicotinamidase-related amidase